MYIRRFKGRVGRENPSETEQKRGGSRVSWSHAAPTYTARIHRWGFEDIPSGERESGLGGQGRVYRVLSAVLKNRAQIKKGGAKI